MALFSTDNYIFRENSRHFTFSQFCVKLYLVICLSDLLDTLDTLCTSSVLVVDQRSTVKD